MMSRRTLSLSLLGVVIALGAANCAGPLPTYSWQDGDTALGTMKRRDGSIQTMSASCRVLLESNGESVELKAGLVAQPPSHLRLRAWKLTQAVFDVTLRPDGLFVFDRGSNGDAKSNVRKVSHAQLVDAISLLPGFGLDDWQVKDRAGAQATFEITRRLSEPSAVLQCEVDRRTLLRLQCTYRDDTGVVRQSLAFGDYAAVGDVVWPMRVEGRGESGAFTLLFDDGKVNVDLPERAFHPPRRAVRQP